ncbi:MAG: Release factor glutamine methyltransferase [Owenweeksia sp. TMED14]|nr:MAG: Release factor glutamine methyltransferase [Owenweeksia sp. TMED14]|tara:strand:+ start:161 stop:1006 length:846 start_codon:yes stop_codon:yes gene_type:complete
MECAKAQAEFLNSMYEVHGSLSESRAIWSEWLRVRHAGRVKWELRFHINLSVDEKLTFQKDLQELKSSKPIAYVLAETFWFGMIWKIDNRALIPRPETEELLSLVLDDIKPSFRVVDACTGSGCIAIATKFKHPSASVTGFDISSNAIDLAKENACFHNVEVNWLNSNILDPIPDWLVSGQDDIWVSNPPYIPNSEPLDESLVYEPKLALSVPDRNPIIFYQKIDIWASHALKSGGLLFLETHFLYCLKVRDYLLAQKKWHDIKIINDDCGKSRFIKAIRL